MSAFCYGDEASEHHACMNGHLPTANQSEIRKAYLVSVCTKEDVYVIEHRADPAGRYDARLDL